MVDLAKIRKKARKKVEEVAAQVVEELVASRQPPVADAPRENVTPPAAASPSPASAISKLEKFKSIAGQRRDLVNAGSAQPEETGESAQLELLTFILAGEQYAVDIDTIVEIVTPRPVTRIPNADPSIVGIISLRGTIVTLVDVRRKLRHPGAETAAPDPRVVVVEQEGETVGFEVDRVLRVIKLDRTAVEPHPVVHISEQDEAIRGVFRQGNALTILLDFDKLLGGRSLAIAAV